MGIMLTRFPRHIFGWQSSRKQERDQGVTWKTMFLLAKQWIGNGSVRRNQVLDMNQASHIVIPVAVLGAFLLHPSVTSQPVQNSHQVLAAKQSMTSVTVTETTVQSSSSSSHKGYGSHLQPILAAINATPEQRQKITEIVAQFKPAIQPLREKYHQKRDEFLKAIGTGARPEDIMAKQCEVNELFDRIINEYCLMNLRVRRLLTPQQCDRFHAYKRAQGWTRTE